MGLFDKIFEKKICSICGGEIGLLGNRKLEDGDCCKKCAAKLSPWFDERRHSTVEQIKALGYDAKVLRTCAACADKLGFKYKDGTPLLDSVMYCVFYFKNKGQKEYHVTRSESPDDYKAVLAYLKNEDRFYDRNEALHWVADNKEEIKRMTGITF